MDLKTIALALIVGLILILSNSMEKAGQMQRLLDNFRGLVKSSQLNLTIVYRILWFPCVALILAAFGYFWFLHWAVGITS